ncbi:MAG TPA: TraR/DksA C4-type zinc finger protein [Alphaproteobacteria bacterium]|jgi:DnaK suppressor protein|nr:TraR/DksA C4-type zinc finger protein [Alphaproteobacteria bacterium]MDP7164731.1 TraR/DksA C4-type zinc finger protein [Alphaproteobacteria bacterium]MDP7428291.1 TraR/DksA C4-type zinc finger protein [Alphaproteobacteria bacterium]HJM51751.1 TraR/DksA C4-type zinc finger protein [Alphaproteobacteria bacterium]|tara:strand:- start:343 stop:672 length:330 start_codon:yes stop_codon:yes gene_type:complete
MKAAKAKARLEQRRQELVEIAAASDAARAPVELDQSRVGRLSRMDALQVQAMSLETDRRRGQEIRRIDAALARLAADEFGDCLRCGEEIEPARLELDPAVPLCIDCAGG